MIPGRIKGSSTRRRKRPLPGKSARSSARAARSPSIRDSTTLPAATIRLLSTESHMEESAKSCVYQLRVRWRGGKPPTPSRLKERSEEHTSELQSPYDLVCRLLLEKKNNDHHEALARRSGQPAT